MPSMISRSFSAANPSRTNGREVSVEREGSRGLEGDAPVVRSYEPILDVDAMVSAYPDARAPVGSEKLTRSPNR